MTWRSWIAIGLYCGTLLVSLALIVRLWRLSRKEIGSLSSLEERIHFSLLPSPSIRSILYSSALICIVLFTLICLGAGIGGWWYGSALKTLSARFSETFSVTSNVAFKDPKLVSQKLSDSEDDENKTFFNKKIDSENEDTEESETATEIYESILPKFKSRNLRLEQVQAFEDGKLAKIYLQPGESDTFLTQINQGPVNLFSTRRESYGLYSLKTKVPQYISMNAMAFAKLHFQKEAAETKTWIWSWVKLYAILIQPLLFVFIVLVSGFRKTSDIKHARAFVSRSLLRSGPIQWKIFPIAKLRSLPFWEQLSQGTHVYGVQVRPTPTETVKVSYAGNNPDQEGRLLYIGGIKIFVPNDLINAIDDYHSKILAPQKNR